MTEDKKGNRPTHNAYQVRNYKAGDTEGSRIGSAWEHKDKKGYDVVLESVPLSGRVVLRLNEPKIKSGRVGPGSAPNVADVSAPRSPGTEHHFQTSLRHLLECYARLPESDELSDPERAARADLLMLCRQIVEDETG